MTAFDISDVELHGYPPLRNDGGQHVGPSSRCGVLAVHRPTGVAMLVDSERSQIANRNLAIERLDNFYAVTVLHQPNALRLIAQLRAALTEACDLAVSHGLSHEWGSEQSNRLVELRMLTKVPT